MKIKLIQDATCAEDEHEVTCYPRPSFYQKPQLPAGTVLTVKQKWDNFYGSYYRCNLPDSMKDKGYSVPWYDIPVRKARVIEP